LKLGWIPAAALAFIVGLIFRRYWVIGSILAAIISAFLELLSAINI
jgi:hypothetical protein